MRKGTKKLLDCSRYCLAMQYPGYPFSKSIVIDFSTNEKYVDSEKVENFNELFAELLYQGIDSDYSIKGTFVRNSEMGTPKEFIEAKEEDFYFDNLDAIKLYFALCSAIRENQDTNHYLFACIDGESSWVEVKVLKTNKQVDKYVENNFPDLEEVLEEAE